MGELFWFKHEGPTIGNINNSTEIGNVCIL